MKILTLILLSILVIPTLASSRTWTSDIGTKIEAEFTSFQNGTVELRASDGRKIELAIGRLSIKDQQYIKDFTGSNFKPKINSNSVNSNLDAYPTELKIGSFMNGIGGIIFILSYIVLLIKAFSEGFLWGIGSFIIPFFVLFFVYSYWQEAKKPFVVCAIAVVMNIVGTTLIMMNPPVT